MDGSSNPDSKENHEYFARKRIHDLFQTLIAALLYHRPDDPVEYLLACVSEIQRCGVRDNWEHFLPAIRNVHDSKISLPKIEASQKSMSSPSCDEKNRCKSTEGNTTQAAVPHLPPLVVSSTVENNGNDHGKISSEQLSYLRSDSTTTTTTNSADNYRLLMPQTSQTASVSDNEDLMTAEGEYNDCDTNNEGFLELDVTVPSALGSFWEVINGKMSNLPPMPSNTIRIFLSSTFSDFKAERNMLPQYAYPKLEAFCATRGIDFQVVDMRWGVTDEVVHDHQVSALCVGEIKRCQQLSCGPNFVVLLGDRYGWQGFPPRIQYEEFATLMEEASNIDKDDTTLVQAWFSRDDNAVPPEYVLQPIHVHLPDDDSRKDHTKQEWNHISRRLQSILRICAKKARHKGTLSEEQERKYFMSVTEEEILHGILMVPDPTMSALAYRRKLQGITNAPKTKALQKFIDLTDDGKDLDLDASRLRTTLVDKKIQSHFGDIKEYHVTWKDVPLQDSEEEEHGDYLKSFCADFVSDIKALVNKRLEDKDDGLDRTVALYHEVLHHAHFGRKKCDIFCGREQEVACIKQYLASGRDGGHRPLVVHSVSGMGKTALVAYVASRLTDWFGEGQCVVAVRFLGTSPLSSSIADTLRSLIEQLSIVFKFGPPSSSSLEMFGNIRRAFHALLLKISSLITEGSDNESSRISCKRVVVLLDSLDQLSVAHGAYRMVWLPKVLPPNVYFVVSTLTTDKMDVFKNIHLRLPNDEGTCYLELLKLSQFTGDQIIDSHLARNRRRLTEPQRLAVIKAFKSLPHPLYLKLVVDEAKTWTSYLPASDLEILFPATCTTEKAVKAAIMKLFESMEAKYGTTLVQRSLGYLTCGKGGLTDIEMEDILSCDDDVLNEVYRYHQPPLEGVVRIPSLLWSRLQHALAEYLCERRVDGKVVRAWYHRQFWETAEERFLQTDEVRQSRHASLADLFLQEYGVHRTITLKHLRGKVVVNADRRIKPQPLDVTNLRKLQAAPYHLYASGQYDLLTRECLVNFKWLLLRLQAISVNAVVREYGSMEVHSDVTLFKKFLDMCFDALSNDPRLLAFNIVERLSGSCQDRPLVALAVEHAHSWLTSTSVPLLVPTHSAQFEAADGPQSFSIMVGYYGHITADESMIVCPWSETNSGLTKIQTLDLRMHDIVASTKVKKIAPLQILPDSRHFIFVEDQTVAVYEMDSGDVAESFTFTDIQYDKVTVRCVAVSDSGKQAAFGVKFGKPQNIAVGERWRSDCMIFLIDIQRKVVLNKIFFKGRKPIDNLFFGKKDTVIIGTSKNKFHVYGARDLILHQEFERREDLTANSFQRFAEKNTIVGLCTSDSVMRLIIFDYDQMSVRCSQDVHRDGPQKRVIPFALHVKSDFSMFLVGSRGDTGVAPLSSICLWRPRDDQCDEYLQHRLSLRQFHIPHSLTAVRDWAFVLVGWQGGQITVFDVEQQCELYDIAAHSHSIFFMHVLKDGNTLVTTSQDHNLKVWDLDLLLKEVRSTGDANTNDTSGALKKVNIAYDKYGNISILTNSLCLKEKEQTLDLIACERFLVSAPSNNLHAPRFWSYDGGKIMLELSETCQHLYSKSISENKFNFPTRMHASVRELPGEVLIYERMRRNGSTVMVIKGFDDMQVLAHRRFEKTFFRLTAYCDGDDIGGAHSTTSVDDSNTNAAGTRMYMVHDGSLGVYDPFTLKSLADITIPALSKEIPNMDSNAAKRRLQNYHVGVTCDGRYFILFGIGVDGKYIDIIQLKKRKYKTRLHLPRYVPFKFLSNGVYFLCKDHKNEILCLPAETCSSSIAERGCDYDYRRLVRTGRFLSRDEKLGCSIDNRSHTLQVWRIDPLACLHVFRGHTHEVTSADISSDNSFLVSGSNDNTVRLWDLQKGVQLATFHTGGAVDGVFLAPSMTHVGVMYYSGPQHKRSMSLKIKNVFAPSVQKKDILLLA